MPSPLPPLPSAATSDNTPTARKRLGFRVLSCDSWAFSTWPRSRLRSLFFRTQSREKAASQRIKILFSCEHLQALGLFHPRDPRNPRSNPKPVSPRTTQTARIGLRLIAGRNVASHGESTRQRFNPLAHGYRNTRKKTGILCVPWAMPSPLPPLPSAATSDNTPTTRKRLGFRVLSCDSWAFRPSPLGLVKS